MNPEELRKYLAQVRQSVMEQGGTVDDANHEVILVGRQLGGPQSGQRYRSRAEVAAANRADAGEDFTDRDAGGTLLENTINNATYGASGNIIDALSPGDFATNRRMREDLTAKLTPRDRDLSTIAGAFLNPVGRIFKAPREAGMAVRGITATADAALQGGAQAALTSLGGTSEDDLSDAVSQAKTGAALGVGVRGLLGLGGATARSAKSLFEAARSPKLDATRFGMEDLMKADDKLHFDQVRREAASVGTSPAIKSLLRSQTIKPLAVAVRKSEAGGKLNDAELLLRVYRGMSNAQRKALATMAKTTEEEFAASLSNESINLAKGRIKEGVMTDLPTFSAANAVHSVHRTNIEAFEATADAVSDIIGKKTQKGKNILLKSPEALRRAILKMGPDEAAFALDGTYGRMREIWKLSPNVIEAFGIPGAVARTAQAPRQINPFLRMLEERAGLRQGPLEQGVRGLLERSAEVAPRIAGGLLSP